MGQVISESRHMESWSGGLNLIRVLAAEELLSLSLSSVVFQFKDYSLPCLLIKRYKTLFELLFGLRHIEVIRGHHDEYNRKWNIVFV